MLSAAASRISFWAITALIPAAAMIHFRDFLPGAAASWLAFSFPAALCSGWAGGATRRSLASSLTLTQAGSGSLLAAELALSGIGGSALALLPLSAMPGNLPWQIWAVAPLGSIFIAALILWLEPANRALSGLAVLALAGLSFVPGRGGFLALISVPGFTFETFRFTPGSPVHPDAYVAMGLLFSVGTVILAVRRMKSLGRP
jgi:hypothetical protein